MADLIAALVVAVFLVKQQRVGAAFRNADAVIVAVYRGEVADEEKILFLCFIAADKAENTAVSVVGVDPLEAVILLVQAVERRIFVVERQKPFHIILEVGVERLFGEIPVEGDFFIPFMEQIRYLFKTIGSGLSPFDSFLVLRGIKTLSVRVERQQENAMKIANWLKEQKKVTDVYYVGLPEHPGYEINKKQSRGAGSMISFRTDTEETARKVLERVKLISYAESLGGVESLITYPMLQTHGDVPVEIRERLGITETFLRLSVGIENVDDLIADLEQALA